MNFHPFIKAVGTGKKHNRDLSQEEMYEAMTAILIQEASPEQIAAFLLGWRLKPESIEEFKGALDAFDTLIKHQPIANSIELGYPYDGKVDNPYLFPSTADYLQAFNLHLVISTDHLQPSKSGTTTQQIAQHLRVPNNVHFLERSHYFKELSNLTNIRKNLGLRTGFNAIERLVNPAKSDYAIIGVFHKPFVKKYIQTYGHRYKRLLILKGAEGAPEILGKCSYWIVEGKEVEEVHIDIRDFGIYHDKSYKRISLERSLELTAHPSKEHLALAKLNAALCLVLTEHTKSLEDAFNLLDTHQPSSTFEMLS